MGQQTGFFTLEEDNRSLLAVPGMHAIPAELPTGSPVEPVAPLDFQRPEGLAVFYLLPAGVPPDAAVYEPMAAPGRSVLIPRKSAVIQFVTCRREGDAIDDGRIYFDTPRSNVWFGDVRRAYERLSRLIKRWPRTDRFRFFVGPTAAQGAQAHKLRLLHMGYELHPVDG
jgi:hypothetical protein